MTLLNPIALYFLLLAPVIVLLFLYRRRRQRIWVPTLRFWQEASGETVRTSFFQRLRNWWSLLFFLLLLLILTGVLGRANFIPQTVAGDENFADLESPPSFGQGGDWLILLDCSLSMAAAAEPGRDESRLDLALAEARRLIEALPRGRQAAIVTNAPISPVRCGFTAEKTTLLESLEPIQPVAQSQSLEDTLRFARMMVSARPSGEGQARIFALTDQALADGGPLRTLRLGQPWPNVGLTQFSARRSWTDRSTVEILVSYANFGLRAQSGTVEVELDGRIVEVLPFQLEPGGDRNEILTLAYDPQNVVNARGHLTARLTLESGFDGLAEDNAAYAVIPPLQKVSVLLVSAGNWFLEKLLSANPAVEYQLLKSNRFDPAYAAGMDVIIYDNSLPDDFTLAEVQPGKGIIILGGAPSDLLLGEDKSVPALLQSGERPPELIMPDLAGVRFAAVPRLASRETLEKNLPDWLWWDPVSTPEGPLVILGEGPRSAGGAAGPRLALSAFGLAETDLAVKLAFPLLMQGLIEWTGRASPDEQGRIFAKGSPEAWRRLGDDAFDRPGFHTRDDGWAAVNSLNAVESAQVALVAPDAGAESPGNTPLAGAEVSSRILPWLPDWPLWIYLGLAAVTFLGAESALYHLRGGRSVTA